MKFNVESKDGVVIISLEGNLLSELQARDVLDRVTELIQDGQVKFIFDLSRLKFINSSGLGMLLTSLTKARKAGGEVILCCISEQLSNLLVITKLNSIFTTTSSIEEAIEKINN